MAGPKCEPSSQHLFIIASCFLSSHWERDLLVPCLTSQPDGTFQPHHLSAHHMQISLPLPSYLSHFRGWLVWAASQFYLACCWHGISVILVDLQPEPNTLLSPFHKSDNLVLQRTRTYNSKSQHQDSYLDILSPKPTISHRLCYRSLSRKHSIRGERTI